MTDQTPAEALAAEIRLHLFKTGAIMVVDKDLAADLIAAGWVHADPGMVETLTENVRLMGAAKIAQEKAKGLLRERDQYLAERDRARNIAVSLENELAETERHRDAWKSFARQAAEAADNAAVSTLYGIEPNE